MKKSLLVAAILMVAGVAVAFAHGGYKGYHGYEGRMMGPGSGHHMMDGYGYGPGPHMRGYGYGPGDGDRYQGLSQEDAQELEQARDKFLNETKVLRKQIDEKANAFRQEFKKENPDKDKLTQLQKELNELEGQFDQKRLEHRLELRKMMPEGFAGRGGYGRGYGRGHGGGYCW
jgi:hypothetical protein